MTSPISEDTTTSDGSKAAADSTKSGGFLADTVDELKLVVWPSRQQLFSESIAVILMVSLSAATIAAVSRFFGWLRPRCSADSISPFSPCPTT